MRVFRFVDERACAQRVECSHAYGGTRVARYARHERYIEARYGDDTRDALTRCCRRPSSTVINTHHVHSAAFRAGEEAMRDRVVQAL